MNVMPIPLTWDGERFTPLPQFRRICARQFVVGESYPMAVDEHRSSASHRHYFAALNDAWLNLPERLSLRFPTAEHLRKWALVHTGFADDRTVVCDTARDARNLAATARALDGFAVITVKKNIVQIYTAKSQSIRAMKRDDFQASKTAVLDFVADLIGVSRTALSREAEKTAGKAKDAPFRAGGSQMAPSRPKRTESAPAPKEAGTEF